jgi:hypothetical protein
MKPNKITFTNCSEWPPTLASLPPSLPVPKPASQYIPEWYAKSERWIGNDNQPKLENGAPNHGLKLCVPFLDAMTSGYMLELHTDLVVEYNEEADDVNIDWLIFPAPLSRRTPALGEKIPRPEGHITTHFAWIGQWGIEVPKGWSVLLTHPFNRFDLPFTTLTGLMDSDKSVNAGNIPFFMKRGFSGLIPAGTPIAQLTPIKRADWVSELGTEENKQKVTQQNYDSKRMFSGFYKKNLWERKKYE